MSDEQIQEAIRAANIVVEFSAYLHKINYSLEKFMKELKAALEHARRQSG